MLEMIKKYRSSPKRTVITLSIAECLSINRQGDLRKAKKACMEHKNISDDGTKTSFIDPMLEDDCCCGCDNENIYSECENREDEHRKTSCTSGDSCYAFGVCDDVRVEGENERRRESECDTKCYELGGKRDDSDSCKGDSIYLSYPCGKMELKGGIRSKKTVRLLLCDVVAMMVGTCAVKCAISKLMKKNKPFN